MQMVANQHHDPPKTVDKIEMLPDEAYSTESTFLPPRGPVPPKMAHDAQCIIHTKQYQETISSTQTTEDETPIEEQLQQIIDQNQQQQPHQQTQVVPADTASPGITISSDEGGILIQLKSTMEEIYQAAGEILKKGKKKSLCTHRTARY